MEINSVGLIIFVIGVVLIIAEAFTPGTFILVPGVALTIVGALIMAFPGAAGSYWTPVIFLAAFVPAFLLAFLMYKRIAPPGRPTTLSSDSLVGRIGRRRRLGGHGIGGAEHGRLLGVRSNGLGHVRAGAGDERQGVCR